MDVVEKLYSGYGETAAGKGKGSGPDQVRIQLEGNKYLKTEFPQLRCDSPLTLTLLLVSCAY